MLIYVVGAYLRNGHVASVSTTEQEAKALRSQVAVFNYRRKSKELTILPAMKKDEETSQKNHSIEAILGILPKRRSSPSKTSKSFVPYSERRSGKN